MPNIRPSSDLRNNYNEISEYCHTSGKPVYITKNGRGDLAVMSMELFEKLTGAEELYALIQEGLDQARRGETRPAQEVFGALDRELKAHYEQL